jgi:hypothetical protein
MEQETKRDPYFVGLAFLGRSQPAVSGMHKIRALNESDWFEVFRAGTWNGHEWTDEDLRAMADSYDPNHREATIGIGHDGCFDSEKPRHGVVADLMHAGGRLYAKFKDLSKDLVDGVAKGLYGDRSSEILLHRYNVNEKPLAFAFNYSTDAFIVTDTTEPETKSTKGDNDMDEKDVRQLISEAQAPLLNRIAELEKRPKFSQEEYSCAKEKLDKFDALEAKATKLENQLTTLQATNAEAEVTALLHGIPKSLATEATKATMLNLAKTDRAAFDALKPTYEGMKKKFSYLSQEFSAENGDGEIVNLHEKAGYVKGKDELDNKISVRAHELMAEAKKNGDTLDFAEASTRAWREVVEEEGE